MATERTWLLAYMSQPGPNPIRVLVSIVKSMRVARPRPAGTGPAPDHSPLATTLDRLRSEGIDGLTTVRGDIRAYRDAMATVQPDDLRRDDALAYWLNLYNAGALDLAASTAERGDASVLRVPGGFTDAWVTVAGETLSLDNIEHGKVRRFADPRIHAALVCGSASCPTLRYEPYDGARLDAQLEDQTRAFFAGGGAVVDGDRVLLSRILSWFGADFARPRRMPTFIPARRSQVVTGVRRWLPDDVVAALDAGARVEFQPYDWSLACSIG